MTTRTLRIIAAARGIGPAAKAMLLVIAAHAGRRGRAKMTLTRLAAMVGVTRGHASRLLRALTQAGLISTADGAILLTIPNCPASETQAPADRPRVLRRRNSVLRRRNTDVAQAQHFAPTFPPPNSPPPNPPTSSTPPSSQKAHCDDVPQTHEESLLRAPYCARAKKNIHARDNTAEHRSIAAYARLADAYPATRRNHALREFQLASLRAARLWSCTPEHAAERLADLAAQYAASPLVRTTPDRYIPLLRSWLERDDWATPELWQHERETHEYVPPAQRALAQYLTTSTANGQHTPPPRANGRHTT